MRSNSYDKWVEYSLLTRKKITKNAMKPENWYTAGCQIPEIRFGIEIEQNYI